MSESRDVEIEAGGHRLAGTLAVPDGNGGRGPAVLCLHGSGPMDRDQNSRHQRLDVFNTLSAALTRAGVACLRYDKRGCGASGGDYLSAGLDDLTADARVVLDWLRGQGFGPVYLLGHSEGTVHAARLSGSADGIVLLCPFVTPGRDILMMQAQELAKALPRMKGFSGRIARLVSRVFGGPVKQQERLLKRLDSTDKPVLPYMGQRLPARALRQFLALDLPALYADVRVPALVLVAECDIQCPPADGARIAGILGARATHLPIADLSHLLRRCDGPCGFEVYGDQMKQPMDDRVTAAVCGWITARVAEC